MPMESPAAAQFSSLPSSSSSSDGYDTVCDGEAGDDCGRQHRRSSLPMTPADPWNSWAALPSRSADGAFADSEGDEEEDEDEDEDEEEEEDDDEEADDEDFLETEDEELAADNDSIDRRELNGTIQNAIGQLMEAQEAVARLWQGQIPPKDSSDYSNKSGSSSTMGIRSNCNSCSGGVSSSGSSCVIKSDNQRSIINHVNQSACNTAGDPLRSLYSSHADENVEAEPTPNDSATVTQEPEWISSMPESSEGPTDGQLEDDDGEQPSQQRKQRNWQQLKPQCQPSPSPPQPQTTCEEDVIGQRLNACLQLLQGGPYQECDLCVKTLSSCDQNQLASHELLDRLNNLETLLLYLQIRYRSQMSCGKLKQLCQLKKTLSCMHGFLLKRQAEQTMSAVDRLHRRLDQTGDFRRHWRPVPAGGEKFRFVADPLDCVPRVEVEDEWLRAYLPASEKASLGHILTDSDPVIAEHLGKRMAFSKRRGRSTRLHNLFTRDSYEDLLRRYQFAFNP